MSKLGVGGSKEGDVFALLLGLLDSGGNLNEGCPYANLPLGEVGESPLPADEGSAGNLNDDPRLSSLPDWTGGGGDEVLVVPATAERFDCLWLAAALIASFKPNECLLLWPLAGLFARRVVFALLGLVLEPVLLWPLLEKDDDLAWWEEF